MCNERRTRPCHRAYSIRGSTLFHSCMEVWSPKLVSSKDRTGAKAPSASYCSTEGVAPLHTAPPVPVTLRHQCRYTATPVPVTLRHQCQCQLYLEGEAVGDLECDVPLLHVDTGLVLNLAHLNNGTVSQKLETNVKKTLKFGLLNKKINCYFPYT
jgi:hypothetical protein